MALIADLCPNCQRVTRCHVVERGSVVGGLILGVPFVLPSSSVSCCCGECGCEFKSETWDYEKTLSPDEAMALDVEAILSLTNPALKERQALSRLKAIPELGGAFHLLEQLKPGNLRTALKNALLQWPSFDKGRREQFLADANGCAEALRFARLMASRSTTGVVGCLGGGLACAGVWAGCVIAIGTQLSLWGWLGVVGAGVMAGSLLSGLLWSGRDRRWLKAVLIPEAARAGIRLGWLLAVLEGSGLSRHGEDELASLRQLAPAIRAELAASGKAVDEAGFAFGALPRVISCGDKERTMDWYEAAGRYYDEQTRPHDERVSSLPAEWQRELVALMLLDQQMNNGAYLQFLANCGRSAYVYARQALIKIGAHRMAEIVEMCQALVDEHFPTEGLPQKERGQLLVNQVLDREGHTVKEAGSVLPEAVVARVYELSYEYMSYPDKVWELAQRHYGPLIEGCK